MTKPDIERSMEANAEEVRAYLVAVRGGAPFLSAADGRLLIHWLEQGFSVARYWPASMKQPKNVAKK